MSYVQQHLAETIQAIEGLDAHEIEAMAKALNELKLGGGRLFVLGVGGSAANAGHAVNDFRKITQIEAYAPTDNVAELTARTNDEGWESVFVEWLKISRLAAQDMLFVLSVGGGSLDKNISPNLVRALQYGKSLGAKVLGIVGRDGGFLGQVGDVVVRVPTVNTENVTPHAESIQGVVWHLLVSHPLLKSQPTKWESTV